MLYIYIYYHCSHVACTLFMTVQNSTNILDVAAGSAVKYFKEAPANITEQYGREWMNTMGVDSRKACENPNLVRCVHDIK